MWRSSNAIWNRGASLLAPTFHPRTKKGMGGRLLRFCRFGEVPGLRWPDPDGLVEVLDKLFRVSAPGTCNVHGQEKYIQQIGRTGARWGGGRRGSSPSDMFHTIPSGKEGTGFHFRRTRKAATPSSVRGVPEGACTLWTGRAWPLQAQVFASTRPHVLQHDRIAGRSMPPEPIMRPSQPCLDRRLSIPTLLPRQMETRKRTPHTLREGEPNPRLPFRRRSPLQLAGLIPPNPA